MRVVAALLAALALAPALAAPAPDHGLDWSRDAAPRATYVQHVGGTTEVLVASTAEGAWRSLDDGASWTPLAGFPPVTRGRIATDPSDPAVLYVAGYGGVARSLDGGATWSHVLAVDRAARIDVSLTGKVLVGARHADATNHVYVSSDRGGSWTNLGGPLPPGQPICGIAFAPHDHWVLTMTDDQSWYSRDGGLTWTETPGAGFEIAIEEDGTVWRADPDSGLERTTDGGATWQQVPLAALPTGIGPLTGGGVALSTNEGLRLTRDGGQTWEDHGFAPAMGVAHGVAADPSRPDAVFVTDPRRGAARVGADADGVWAYRGLALGTPVALDRLAGDGTRLVAGGLLGLYASGDGGAHWAHTGGGFAVRPRAVAVAGAAVYAGGTDGSGTPVVEASGDGGRTFRLVALPEKGEVVALAARGDAAWAAVALANDLGRLDATGDGGATWSTVLALPFPVHDLALRPDGSLLVGTASGAFVLELGVLRPLGVAPGATRVAAGGTADFAASSLGASVWAAERPLPLRPYQDLGPVADLAAGDGSLWAVTGDSALQRCAGAACHEETPPGGGVQAALEAGGLVAAATAGGLWQARL